MGSFSKEIFKNFHVAGGRTIFLQNLAAKYNQSLGERCRQSSEDNLLIMFSVKLEQKWSLKPLQNFDILSVAWVISILKT